VPSELVRVIPNAQTNAVIYTGAYQTWDAGSQFNSVNSNTFSGQTNQFGLVGNQQVTGLLTPLELCNNAHGYLASATIGTGGYYLPNFGGNGVTLSNLPSGFTVTVGSGWANAGNGQLNRYYSVSGTNGTANGLEASSSASVTITPADTNLHYVTIDSASASQSTRTMTWTATSTNGQSAANTFTSTFDNVTAQFEFAGAITLSVSGISGSTANLAALFFDSVPVVQAPPPPASLILVGQPGSLTTIIVTPGAGTTIIAQ
jgi:hypothetical protein